MIAAPHWLRWRPRFRHVRTKLVALYTGLFAFTLLLIAVAAQLMVTQYVRASVRTELETSSSVFDRIWMLRAQALGESAGVLARDFGFRAAVASGDRATIASALASMRARAHVHDAFIVALDGSIVGEGDAALRETVMQLPFKLSPGRHDAVVASGARVYRMVVAPVLAPTEIGWIVLAVRLDAGEMASLQALSAIRLTATVLRRDPQGGWMPAADGVRADNLPLAAALRRHPLPADGSPERLHLPGGTAMALARPLAGAGTTPEAALLLSYPLASAVAAYRGLQIGILLAGIVGLALVLWGSRRLAKGIARPIVALQAAAQALETGDRTEVRIVGVDEIGQLAESFNRMSKGIVEREHRIAHLAFHDPLTGLPNRALFREQLDDALGRARTLGQQAAVLYLDLDGFKSVNDTLGHPVGDALLALVAERLRDLVPDGVAARLGGDEFAIILGNITPDRPRAEAQTILDALRLPFSAAGHQISTGTSIGIAVGPQDGADPDTLLKNADLALYRAKQDGRGVSRFFEPALDAAARARRQLELDLREALTQGQLRLDFQPIYDIRTERYDRIGGFEALMRWDHPTRGLVSPVEFIPVAEETGMIIAMGEWVIHEACREAASWGHDLKVAVNVSPLQFRSSGFANIVFQALARTGIAPARLEIEITESIFLEGAEQTIALLHRLRAMGVRIALDDFGTGYSSLSYLRSFPFDKIKIDRSFVTNVALDASAAAIVHAIVDLAAALHMETTAEGVEDEAQLAELRQQGCSSIQGFLFSRPVHASAVRGLIETAARRAA